MCVVVSLSMLLRRADSWIWVQSFEAGGPKEVVIGQYFRVPAIPFLWLGISSCGGGRFFLQVQQKGRLSEEDFASDKVLRIPLKWTNWVPIELTSGITALHAAISHDVQWTTLGQMLVNWRVLIIVNKKKLLSSKLCYNLENLLPWRKIAISLIVLFSSKVKRISDQTIFDKPIEKKRNVWKYSKSRLDLYRLLSR